MTAFVPRQCFQTLSCKQRDALQFVVIECKKADDSHLLRRLATCYALRKITLVYSVEGGNATGTNLKRMREVRDWAGGRIKVDLCQWRKLYLPR